MGVAVGGPAHIDWGVEPHGTGLADVLLERGVETMPYVYVAAGDGGAAKIHTVTDGTLPKAVYDAAVNSLGRPPVTISGRQYVIMMCC